MQYQKHICIYGNIGHQPWHKNHGRTNLVQLDSAFVGKAHAFLLFCLSTPPQWMLNKTVKMLLKCRLSDLIQKVLPAQFWGKSPPKLWTVGTKISLYYNDGKSEYIF